MTTQATKCECTMAQRCTGSGCRYCNPQEYIDMLHEQIADVGVAQAADSVPSRFGSPELQAMILARCVEKDQADSVQEDAEWMPLTPELLTAIESGDHGRRFWLAAHNNSEPLIGCYEWQQGRNPHGFNVNTLRYGASEIAHVLPYKPPTLPEARKQGEKQ